MKTLSTLTLLAAASAAQAYTLDVNVGHSRVDNYDNVSVVGLGIGTHLNSEYHLGLNFAQKNLTDIGIAGPGGVDAKARTATLDLTYSLSQGGIRPFIGAGVGGVHFSGDSVQGPHNCFASKLFAGIAFPVSQNVDFSLTVQNSKFYNVQILAPGGAKTNITSWDALAGLRFSF